MRAPPRARRSRRTWAGGRVPWALAGAALLLRAGLVLADAGIAPVLDEVAYLDLARGLLEDGHLDGTFRPPLYPVFLAAALATGAGPLLAELVQALLGAASVVLAYRLGTRVGGVAAGRVAAVVVAVDPVLIFFTARLWSETLFIFLLLAALDLLTVRSRRGRALRWTAAGVALGLAGLTRPLILTFVPLLLPWAFWQARRPARPEVAAAREPADPPSGNAVADGGRRVPPAYGPWLAPFGALALACAVVVAPWTARNSAVTGDFVLVDSNGAFNLLVGSQPEAAFVDKDDRWSWRYGRVAGRDYRELADEDAGRAQDLAVRAALDNVAAGPARFLRKAAWEAGHLWTLDSFLLRHLRNDWFGEVPRWAVAAATVGTALFAAGLTVAGFVGLAATRPSPLRGLALLLLLHSTLLFALTYSLSRYAVPLHPVLAAFAAPVLCAPRAALRRLREGPLRRPLLLGLALAGLAAAWAGDLPLLRDMVETGGREHRFEMERAPDGRTGSEP